jgi:NAD(P)-dependent dehydrogenase (short-subunit alcohol dehydrogenase family)
MPMPCTPLALSGKRILVTGASAGIGRACAVKLAALGAECVLIGRNRERLEETRQSLAGAGHLVLPFDLSRIDDIASLPVLMKARERQLSGLVHSAGICPIVPLAATTPKVLQETFQINFGAFVELCRQFTKRFFFNDGGSLVALSSVSSMIGWPGGSAYCSAKAALNGYIRVLALELARRKIRANTVCPSYVKTAMMDSTGSEAERTFADCEAAQPLGIIEPGDVAGVVAFLMSDESRFITGTNLVVDGGYLAKGN